MRITLQIPWPVLLPVCVRECFEMPCGESVLAAGRGLNLQWPASRMAVLRQFSLRVPV